MKKIGLIGGMTWHSTAEYYRLINEGIAGRLGGLHSGTILVYSVNFAEFQPPLDPAAWDPLTASFIDIAGHLQHAGAECILFCSNTPHLVAGRVQERIRIPLLHIAEACAAEIVQQKIRTVGLLGTRITMEQPFYTERLERSGIRVLVPDEGDRGWVHASIFEELGRGIFSGETKKNYLKIIDSLRARGAEAVVFACTEIPLLLKQADCPVPVFDTTKIHADAAVEFALTGRRPNA